MTYSLDIEGLQFSIEAAGEPERCEGWWLVPAGDVVVDHPFGATQFYRHGWHSWALTHWADLGAPAVSIAPERRMFQADDLPNLDGLRHRGSWVGAISGPDGDALVLGALGWDAHVEATASDITGHCDAAPVEWFIGFGNAEAMLARYATAVAERAGTRRKSPGPVWCSWYSFYEDITEAAMIDVLAGLEGSSFSVVQLDDGWQEEIGDWTVNDDFPSGMSSMAARIRDAGYRPGLWIAPFIVHERSATASSHPEWLVRDAGGNPAVAGKNWGGHYYALDLTRPDVTSHVQRVIARAVEWGFTYLKLDFLFAAGIEGDRLDNSLGREAVYRRGIEAIRDAAGPDTYLLACGGLIVPSIGVFEATRVGQDVAPHWENQSGDAYDYAAPSTRYAVSNSHSRLWLDPVIAVDPDVVYFRTQHNEMSLEEMAYLRDIALVCDFVATSDPPHWLTAEERVVLDQTIAHQPTIKRLDRYRFEIGGRITDFREASLDA